MRTVDNTVLREPGLEEVLAKVAGSLLGWTVDIGKWKDEKVNNNV